MTAEAIIASKFLEKVRPLVDEAVQSIDVCVFDWRWYPSDPGGTCQQFNRAIVDAIRRGVEVRAIVNNQNVAETLRQVGAQVKKFQSAHLLHAKLMILDEKIIITGSHNYTQSAFAANYELSVIMRDLENVSEYTQFFHNLWQH